jgi:hypothetical protein
VPPDRDPGEELLQSGGWSRRTVVAIAVGVLVVVTGVVVGLTRSGGGSSSAQHSADPSAPQTGRTPETPAVTGNAVVIQGSSYGFGTTATAHHGLIENVVAALVSIAESPYSVLYPISVSGLDKAISVDDVEIAADDMNESQLVPAPLTTIRPGSHIEIWMKLRIRCGQGEVSFRRGTVSIALAGTFAPAVFKFGDLFGSGLNARRRPC